MGTIIYLGVGLVSLVVTVLLLGVFLYKAASNNMQATFVAEGTMRFVVTGQDLYEVLLNVDGHTLRGGDGPDKYTIVKVDGEGSDTTDNKPDSKPDTGNKPVKARGKSEVSWIIRELRKRWGFYWVSLFYPWRSIHEFPITKARIGTRPTTASTSVLDRVESDPEPVMVDHLLFNFPRPIVIPGVETNDGFEVDILLQVIVQVVNPYIPVFLHKGKFFPLLEASVSNAVINYIGKMTYLEFRGGEKGQGSEFAKAVIAINEGPATDMLTGIKKRLGLEIVDVSLEQFELAKISEGTASKNPFTAKEIQARLGEADVVRSLQDKEAASNRAKGAAARTLELVAALRDVDPNVVDAVSRIVVSDNIAASKVTVLAGGGGGVLPTIPIEQPANAPSQAQEKQEKAESPAKGKKNP